MGPPLVTLSAHLQDKVMQAVEGQAEPGPSKSFMSKRQPDMVILADLSSGIMES